MPPDDRSFSNWEKGRTGQRPTRPSFSHPPKEEDWETIPLPGTLGIESMPETDATAAALHHSQSSPPRQGKRLTAKVDAPILKKLHARIEQLEEALEASQRALQQEVERSQPRPFRGEEQLLAAQHQSVAQLLSELEQSNAALKRQSILAETVQAQLATAQERNKQLEREHVLLQKRHSEKVQKLLSAEETCRDLRSRLQRQQRYTLQFKAALEKCLEAPTFNQSAAEPSRGEASSPPANLPSPVAMPRTESIQPWSTTAAVVPPDPHLRSLMRSPTGAPTDAPTAFPEATSPEFPTAEPPSSTEATADLEAENLLWQDMERVIESSTTAARAETSAATASALPPPETTAEFTEPMPWGNPIPPSNEAPEPSEPGSAPLESALPSPEPESSALSQEQLLAALDTAGISLEKPPLPAASELPAMDAARDHQVSPSPLVHPLRPAQKKRKSLSAVELPSFPPLPKLDKPSSPTP